MLFLKEVSQQLKSHLTTKFLLLLSHFTFMTVRLLDHRNPIL